jgi:serine/threonine-protein kinase HipA
MPRHQRRQRLNVFLNSRHVGQLSRAISGAVDFHYDPEWLAWDHALPVSLSLPLREEPYVGAPVAAVFDNLLPENPGIRRRVAERVGAEGVDTFSLLFALGRDCVGALQFMPDGSEPGPSGAADGHEVTDTEVGAMLRNLAQNPLGMDSEDDFRISIAGVQEKTALLRKGGQWLRPVGAAATTHILKPQIGKLSNGVDLSNSVENEFLCLTLTRAFGLASAVVEMATFDGVAALVVERFDRLWTSDARLLRVPQEDCCQALSVPWTQKYENEGGPGIVGIMKLLAASDVPDTDQRYFLKSIIAFWLLGATDGHAKNFSIFLSPGGGFRMTPLYDVLSAQPNFDARQIRHNRFRLSMAVGRSRHYVIGSVAPRHFVETAELAGMGRRHSTSVIDELLETVPGALDQTLAATPLGFPAAIAEAIAGGVKTRLEQLGRADTRSMALSRPRAQARRPDAEGAVRRR